MASMVPTAAGQYSYVSEFAPRHWRRPLSYCTGWMIALAWQSMVAVDCYIISGILQEVIRLNNPTYNPTAWIRTLLTILTSIIVAAFNIFGASHLPFAEGVSTTCHVFALVPVCVMLWVMVSPKTPAADVFLHFKDYTHSWPSAGLSALIGQTTAIFSTIRCDGAAHMAEEVQRADEMLPYGMVWSFILNIPLTFIMLLTYLFNIGSVEAALDSPFPFVRVFESALQTPKASIPFSVLILLLMLMITSSTMAAASRKIFVFARQSGLPFSNWTSRVSPRFGVPVNAIAQTAAFASVLNLLNVGSSVAFDTMVSLAASSLMATYSLAIGTLILRRMRKEPLPRACWPLGKWGLPINCMALVYAALAFFWPLWPGDRRVTVGNFNWAVVFFLAWMGLGALFYWWGAKVNYKGSFAKSEVGMSGC